MRRRRPYEADGDASAAVRAGGRGPQRGSRVGVPDGAPAPVDQVGGMGRRSLAHHQNSPNDAPRILAMAAVCAFQSRVSRFSVVRPREVSA
jgi:hypothetical protein